MLDDAEGADMAYQQQGGMGNGGPGGEHHAAQGTEYTLQGKSILRDTWQIGSYGMVGSKDSTSYEWCFGLRRA